MKAEAVYSFGTFLFNSSLRRFCESSTMIAIYLGDFRSRIAEEYTENVIAMNSCIYASHARDYYQ